MTKLQPDKLYSLEEYARIRPQFRQKVIEHKRQRRLPLGRHAALYFEDYFTVQYQVQEMLRIEKIFEPEGIAEELAVYNPLIPDGHNLKATFMLEYEDPDERRQALAQLRGIDRAVWLQVAGFDPVTPISNEDLERETEDKTASVHFMRFEFSDEEIAALKQGAALYAGIEHPHYSCHVDVSNGTRRSLVGDLH